MSRLPGEKLFVKSSNAGDRYHPDAERPERHIRNISWFKLSRGGFMVKRDDARTDLLPRKQAKYRNYWKIDDEKLKTAVLDGSIWQIEGIGPVTIREACAYLAEKYGEDL